MKKNVRIFSYLPREELRDIRSKADEISNVEVTDGESLVRVMVTRPENAEARQEMQGLLLSLIVEDQISDNQIALQEADGEPELSVIFAPMEEKPEFVSETLVSSHAEVRAFLS